VKGLSTNQTEGALHSVLQLAGISTPLTVVDLGLGKTRRPGPKATLRLKQLSNAPARQGAAAGQLFFTNARNRPVPNLETRLF
jgi:hypothetical protein